MIIGINEYSKRFPPYFTNVGEIEDSINGHREIIAALNSRDEDLTERLMRDHTKKSYIHVIQRLNETRLELES
jgi:DNA-binding GntR family transcriptional regulator